MNFPGLNLARRPFTNARPVVRGAILLWILGAALFAGNVLLYRESLSGRTGKGAELVELEQQLDSTRLEPAELASELREIDLDQMNLQVQFLNERIGARTFGWSSLFDRLTEVLPNEVRLIRLSPRVADREAGGIALYDGAQEAPPVELVIEGAARNERVIVKLVDALFAHPQFADVDLTREAREKGGEYVFSLEAKYLSSEGLSEAPKAESEIEEPEQSASEPGEQPEARAVAATGEPEAATGEPEAATGEPEVATGESEAETSVRSQAVPESDSEGGGL